MWQRLANNIPQQPRKCYQPRGFVWGMGFLGPETYGYWARKFSQRCMVHLVKTALGQGMYLCCCWMCPFLDWNSITTGMARLYSQMDSRRFLKFQASRVSMWWIMGEGGSITIKLACRVQTLASSRHKLPLHVPRLTRFALTTWSIAKFICEYYLFDSKPICLWEHMLRIPQPCGCYKICRYNADIYIYMPLNWSNITPGMGWWYSQLDSECFHNSFMSSLEVHSFSQEALIL